MKKESWLVNVFNRGILYLIIIFALLLTGCGWFEDIKDTINPPPRGACHYTGFGINSAFGCTGDMTEDDCFSTYAGAKTIIWNPDEACF